MIDIVDPVQVISAVHSSGKPGMEFGRLTPIAQLADNLSTNWQRQLIAC